MPNNNSNTNVTNDQSLTITIDGWSLSDDQLDETLEQVRTALKSLVRDEDSSPTATVTVRAGQQFPAVNDTCPLCDADLLLTDLTIDTENGATATATCQRTECDWHGWAVYRIIDLEWHTTDEIVSAVETDHVTPRWQPY
jgi:hypothetical protein